MFGLTLAFLLRRLCAFASWGFDDRLEISLINYVRALRLGVSVLKTIKAYKYKFPYLSMNQTLSDSIAQLSIGRLDRQALVSEGEYHCHTSITLAFIARSSRLFTSSLYDYRTLLESYATPSFT